jgi:hypothetical protein
MEEEEDIIREEARRGDGKEKAWSGWTRDAMSGRTKRSCVVLRRFEQSGLVRGGRRVLVGGHRRRLHGHFRKRVGTGEGSLIVNKIVYVSRSLGTYTHCATTLSDE